MCDNGHGDPTVVFLCKSRSKVGLGAWMNTPQDQPDVSQGAGAPSPGGRPRLSGAVGVAIVLGCLVLSGVLGVWSVTTEQVAGEKAARELEATATSIAAVATPSAGQTPAQAHHRLLDQHYYFVNGCVSAPVDCGKATGDTWGEYYTELRHLYDEAAASVAGRGGSRTAPTPTFDEWAKTHVHFLSGQTAAAGAYQIEQSLPQNKDQADIHMIGTSAGGASIFAYLSRAMRGEVALDRRVRSGIAVDSPLGFQFPFRSSDLFLGI